MWNGTPYHNGLFQHNLIILKFAYDIGSRDFYWTDTKNVSSTEKRNKRKLHVFNLSLTPIQLERFAWN